MGVDYDSVNTKCPFYNKEDAAKLAIRRNFRRLRMIGEKND
ncbi:MAG: hypothetical protein RR355_00115 [Oscillospiraceae bacterium]